MSRTNPFETMADEYDAWFDHHPDLFESEVRAVRALLPPRGGLWVEIGVGTGRFASRLGIPLGVEPAQAMAVRATRRGVRVIQGRAESLPFPDGCADAAFFLTTLCFVDDVGLALREAHRILRSRGVVVVAFFPRASPIGRQMAADPQDSFFRAARLLEADELRVRLAEAGFRVERMVQTLTRPGCEAVEDPTEGSDCGSFVVVRARRASTES